MAKPAGTIFVELTLDDKVYKERLSGQLTSAQATAKGIETSWKVLGAKNDATYDAMRRSYENALTLIKNSTDKTKQDIIRAEEAAAAKIKAINTRQFGAQVGTIEKLKANWIAASAAVAAAGVVINRAMTYIEEGAKAMQVESAFEIMADSAGVNSERMIESMKKATRETIDDSAMMQKAIKLMLAGYNPEQIERFSKVVITSSIIAGTTAAEAYDRLADAIATRMPKALQQMGAVTREQMTIVKAAIAAGADSIVIYELAMANLELKQLKLKGTMDAASIAVQQFHARMGELTETIGKGLIWALEKAYHSVEFYAGAMMGLVSAYAQYRALVYSAMGDEKQAAENRWVADRAMETRQELLKRWGDAVWGAAETEKVASKESINAAEDKVKALMAELTAMKDAEASKKGMLGNLTKQYKDLYDEQIAGAEHAAKVSQDAGWNELAVINILYQAKLDALRKWYGDEAAAISKYSKTPAVADTGRAALDAEYSKKFAENENKRSEAVLGYSKKRIEVESAMYKEVNQYSTESMLLQVADIELKAKENGRWTDDQVLKAKFLAEEISKLEDAKTAKALSGFTTINEYSERAFAARRSQYEREARLVEAATDGEVRSADYVAKKVEEDRNKMRSSAAGYYDAVIGYSNEWLALVVANLEEERKKVEETTKSEAFSYAWLADQKRKAENAAAIKGEDFAAGFSAQMDEYARMAATVGEQGAAVAKAITSSMESSMGEFFDSTSEKFLSFKDLALSILRDISKAMISELITKPLVASMAETVNGGGGGGIAGMAGSFLGMFGSMIVGGLSGSSSTGMGTNTEFGSGGTMGGYMSMVKHSGGMMTENGPMRQVPAISFANAPRYHDGFVPGEVPAILKRDEGVFTPGQMKALGKSSLTINVPVTADVKSKKMSSDLRMEIEDTVERVVRRYS